jgi:hypothetical protein
MRFISALLGLMLIAATTLGVLPSLSLAEPVRLVIALIDVDPHQIRASRTADGLFIRFTIRNRFNAPVQMIAVKKDAFISSHGRQWPITSASGIGFCDFQTDCETPQTRRRHAVTIEPQGSLAVAVMAAGSNLPDVGSLISLRLDIDAGVVAGQSAVPPANAVAAVDRTIDRRPGFLLWQSGIRVEAPQ